MKDNTTATVAACIARDDGESGWVGYYVHDGGAPDRVGRVLVEMVRALGADTVLARASVAPRGWASFPEEPSAVAPDDAEAYEWQYLIDADDEIKVYRASSGDDVLPARSWTRVGSIDPLRPDAGAAMAALRHIRPDRRWHGEDSAAQDAASAIGAMRASRTPTEAEAILSRARAAFMDRLGWLRLARGKEAEADACAEQVALLDRAAGRWN